MRGARRRVHALFLYGACALFALSANGQQPAVSGIVASYHLGINGESVGPLALDELSAYVADGRLTETTLAWTEGMSDWAAAGTIATLAAVLAGDGAQSEALTGEYLIGSWRTTDAHVSPNWGPMESDLTQILSADGTMVISGVITYLDPPWEEVEPPFVTDIMIMGTWEVVGVDTQTLFVEQLQNIVQTSSQFDGELAYEERVSLRLSILDDNSFHDGNARWQRIE